MPRITKVNYKGTEYDVGAIDTTLTQAGQAADAKVTGDEITGLKEDLKNIVVSNNVFDKKYTANCYVNAGNGNLVSADGWNATDYIKLESGETYFLFNFSSASFAFYKSDKTYVDLRSNPDVCSNNKLKTTIVVPANVTYLRLSFSTSNIDYLYVSKAKSSDVYTKVREAFEKKDVYVANEISFIDGKYFPNQFVNGSFDSFYNPTNYLPDTTVSSRQMMFAPCDLNLSCNNGAIYIHIFDENGEYISGSGWVTSYSINRGTFYKIGIRSVSNSTLEDIVNLVSVKSSLLSVNFVQSICPPIIFQCRDGMVTNNIPPNSKYAIQATAKNQYDRIRLSVAKTTDGKYVCVHDVNINNLAVNTDGTAITTTIATRSCSLAELNAYDWGLKFGPQYGGLKVPMLEDSLKLATLYGLGVTLDFKFAPTDEEIDDICKMLAKACQNDAILSPLTIPTMVKFSEKSKYLSYYFNGTEEQIESNIYWFNQLRSTYNRIYIQPSPFGEAPTDAVINLCAQNDLDIYMTPVEGIEELKAMGFDKGIKLYECHYIKNIKATVRAYADTLVNG